MNMKGLLRIGSETPLKHTMGTGMQKGNSKAAQAG